ncbi:DNA recombination protein RmuC [Larsenimonas salina]|uniref:DNA recombination protein RmuC n=1 Tax=Larsenimonas salina TaxID=1295565 RepID=UPI002072B8EC|nr:DNA recombination protein RmuC [Larsenimonas salina]MCM5705046.1 DNA recombination protein RmuC [Larsenimonas salina]
MSNDALALVVAMIAGLLCGALVPVWLLRRRIVELGEALGQCEEALEHKTQECSETERLLAERDALLEQSQQTLKDVRQEFKTLSAQAVQDARARHDAETQLAVLESRHEQAQAHHAAQLDELKQARARLTQEFEHLAGRIFDERSRQFDDRSRQSLEALLGPFREQVGHFQRRLETLHSDEQREQVRLRTQIDQLANLNRQMSDDAANLTKALKGDRKQQGNWGEMLLETVLERSGLRKGHEYRREVALTGEQGRARPDVIIDLPEGRHLVVDAKVSLVDYLAFIECEEESARRDALKRHLAAVRQHVERLARKDYAALHGLNSPDMVFLFMPVEPAFALAFEHDPTLFQFAFDRHIVLVTPTTLLASLRTVANLWRLERQNENARAITERAERLLGKFHGFVSSLEDVGEQLTRAQKSHQQALNRLKDGQGSLVNQAEQLRELGVRHPGRGRS